LQNEHLLSDTCASCVKLDVESDCFISYSYFSFICLDFETT